MDERSHGEPIEILLVEDNPGDVRLTEEAFDRGGVLNNLHVVKDGVEAMRYLRCEGEYEGSPQPDLILLDLNLPRKDGEEVLKDIDEDRELRRIPVVVLTSSEAEEDVVKSYELHANAYITKPVDIDQFIDVAQNLEAFWLSIVKLPPNDE